MTTEQSRLDLANEVFAGLQENRWFIRCLGCLSIAAIDEEPSRDMRCGGCGSELETMGRVEEARLVNDEVHATCDARCTHARGPKCTCFCRCKNHGKGTVVKVVRDRGPVPLVEIAKVEEAKAIAQEFLDAKARVLASINEIRDRRMRERVPYDVFLKMVAGDKALRRANALRKHEPRMKTLNDTLVSMAA